jgi:KaiC/GvpD/RAD55 family RecA-like ATPase
MPPIKKTYLEKHTAEFDRVLAEISKQYKALVKDGKLKRKSHEQLIESFASLDHMITALHTRLETFPNLKREVIDSYMFEVSKWAEKYSDLYVTFRLSRN